MNACKRHIIYCAVNKNHDINANLFHDIKYETNEKKTRNNEMKKLYLSKIELIYMLKICKNILSLYVYYLDIHLIV